MIKITVFQDGESMGTGAYEQERVLLGCADDVDLQVKEPGVQEEHAEVFASGGKVYVRKLSQAPIWVGGQEVERSELTPDANGRLRIGGDLEFSVSYLRKPSGTTAVKRVGAISFGSVKTYDEKELESAPSNKPLDLTKTSAAAAAAAKAKAKKSVSERAIEMQEEEKKRAIMTILVLTLGGLFVIAVLWFGIVPTIQKYFFYEDEPIPGG